MKTKLTKLALKLLLGLIGFILLLNPQIGVNFARYYIGLILIATSIAPFLSFYGNREEKELFSLLQGIGLVAIGLVFLLSFNFSALFFALLLVMWMLSSALMKVIVAFQYRRLVYGKWWYMLIFGIISFGFACYMLMNLQQALMFFVSVAGIFMLGEASMGIISDVLFENNQKK